MPAPAMPGMPGMPEGTAAMVSGDMPRMMEMMHQRMATQVMMCPLQHIEGQIAYYRAELRMTHAQQSDWNTFANALRGGASTLRDAMMRAAQASEPTAAPGQIQRRIGLLSAQIDVLRSLQAAGEPLYAVLSDEQKHTADELLAEHFRSMREMMP